MFIIYDKFIFENFEKNRKLKAVKLKAFSKEFYILPIHYTKKSIFSWKASKNKNEKKFYFVLIVNLKILQSTFNSVSTIPFIFQLFFEISELNFSKTSKIPGRYLLYIQRSITFTYHGMQTWSKHMLIYRGSWSSGEHEKFTKRLKPMTNLLYLGFNSNIVSIWIKKKRSNQNKKTFSFWWVGTFPWPYILKENRMLL